MQTILNQLNKKDLAGSYRDEIKSWVELWQGNIKGFHDYREYNGREYVTRYRKTLGMGKKVCEDWADTLYNPETRIVIGESEAEKEARMQQLEADRAELEKDKLEQRKQAFDNNIGNKTDKTEVATDKTEETPVNSVKEVNQDKTPNKAAKEAKTKSEQNQEKLDAILEDNNFVNRFNILLEKTWAFGTGATVENKDADGKVKIDFVDVRNIYPLKVQYGEIVDVAFSTKVDDETVALQLHEKDGEKYVITNHLFKMDENSYTKKEIPKGIEESFVSDVRLFQIIKPALANNVDIDQPLGLSVLANAVDEIKGVDQAYSSLDSELTTGRIRAFIQVGGLSYGTDETGRQYPHYDKNQQEYYVLPEDNVNDEGTFIKVDTPNIRVPQIEMALEKHLTLCGRKVGFGDDAYSFRDGSIYTNTAQIVSTNSKFFKTRQKHLSVLEKALIDMVRGIMYLHDKTEVEEISVDFDDSIIEDTDAVFERNMMLLNGGHISIQEFFERTENLTEELAQELVDKINDDKGLTEEIPLEGEQEFGDEDDEADETVKNFAKLIADKKGN